MAVTGYNTRVTVATPGLGVPACDLLSCGCYVLPGAPECPIHRRETFSYTDSRLTPYVHADFVNMANMVVFGAPLVDHPDSAAFVEALRNTPTADFTPRLIYADFLEDNGFDKEGQRVRQWVEDEKSRLSANWDQYIKANTDRLIKSIGVPTRFFEPYYTAPEIVQPKIGFVRDYD